MSIDPTIIDRTLSSPQGVGALEICEILQENAYEAWWVGGCVRDMFLEEIPEDIDIATSAKPEDLKKLFEKFDDTAEDLGSLLISKKGHVYEVTTFRKDHDRSNGRHPESVTFASREEDAQRRDITINAMYWNPISGELYDPCNARDDLNEKLIRFIGNPEDRIAHDALRLLRVIRFRSLIAGQYHPDTFTALHTRSSDVSVLSGERCLREIEKMLLGPHPEIAFEDLWETDVIEQLLPELHACKGVGQPSEYHQEGDVWNHIIQCISSYTEDHQADVRWAALLHDIGKPPTFSIDNDRIRFNDHASVGGDITQGILERLQMPRKRIDKIVWLVEHHMTMGTFTDLSDVRKAHWYYHPWFIELLQLFWLDIAGSTPQKFEFYEEIIDDYNHFLDSHPKPPRPLLNGDEVMDILGIQPGEKVGEILQILHEKQINGDIARKTDAIQFLEDMQSS